MRMSCPEVKPIIGFSPAFMREAVRIEGRMLDAVPYERGRRASSLRSVVVMEADDNEARAVEKRLVGGRPSSCGDGFAAGEDRRRWSVTIRVDSGDTMEMTLEEAAGGPAAVNRLMT